MKYVILIGDGMSDLPVDELEGKTPLAVAKTPHLDELAKEGLTGMVKNVPEGLKPGSDVATLSIFGYDPLKYYTGRGPLEAASLGIELEESDVAFRCNLVTIEKGIMKDFTAHHIETEVAKKIMAELNRRLGSREITFYGGVSYRHLMVAKHGPESGETTPPHDITGKEVEPYLPKGEVSALLRDLMERSKEFMQGSLATQIWLWGQGRRPRMKSFFEKYHLSGSVIAAVDLLKGIGFLAGLDTINVPGATGYLDTNYEGKVDYALKSLQNKDFVLLHVEAPDETGHEGDVKKKIQAIEDFDERVVKNMMKGLEGLGQEYRVMILPDHPTPVSLKTHTADPVPFLIYGSGVERDRVETFSEKEVLTSKLKFDVGAKLMDFFLSESL